MKRKVESALIELGVTPNLNGFEYICKAVECIQKNGCMKIGDVYSYIALDCGSSYEKVERNIRHAISKMKKKGEAWEKYISINNVTNSAVLFTLALNMREED